MQAAQRLYQGFPMTATESTAGGGTYSRTRHCMTSTNVGANFFAGGIDESAIFQQARAAEAAMATGGAHISQWQFPASPGSAFRGMDVKDVKYTPGSSTNSVLRPTDVLSYHNAHLSASQSQLASPGGVVDSFASFSSHLAEAASSCMPSSMDQQMAAVAMQHYHHPSTTQFHSQYGGMVGHFGHPGGPLSSTINGGDASSPTPRYPSNMPMGGGSAAAAAATGEPDTDPRELERFAEHFKQRRIKLGVTQADVGKALAHLKMPGVGSLSQSTICRFESLTLSHNNMVALKPILQSWLERAEDAVKAKNALADGTTSLSAVTLDAFDSQGILPSSEKKRKRTSIAAPEKRSLEAYFALQPRPSGERIAAIADKLDLKKNVVRVWFCNQRQKQKRCRNQSSSKMPGNQKVGHINGYFGD